MLIYVENKAFPHRTFVVRVHANHTIARVRAQILHILYEIGREDHQFRLRFKGEYLRDAYTVNDYGIVESAIIKMIPLSKISDSFSDIQSWSSDSITNVANTGLLNDVRDALKKEVSIFDKREEVIFHFKGLLYLYFMAGVLSFLTTYWYCGFWTLVLWFLATYYCPTFTRVGGYIGSQSMYKERYCVLFGIAAILCLAVDLYFCSTQWIVIINHGCKDWEFIDECSRSNVFSAIFYGFLALLLLISTCMIFLLLWNVKIEYGDYVEKHLVRNRDIEEVMKSAKSFRAKERRMAAFELATLAASGDDNKFCIVAEGGMDVLIRLALSKDEATQEHAVEALAELITVPAIQDNFVEMGGIRTLTALLHSHSERLIYQVTTALSYIVADSEENKSVVVSDHGLQDLSHAAQKENLTNQRLLAGIFLELAFNVDVRSLMGSLNTPAQALIVLCRSPDPDTQRYALQTLELLAIESPQMICAQDELLDLLLDLPSHIYDSKVLILAGKILLYFAENPETCEALLDSAKCRDSLMKYARTRDAILQKVAVKVIYCMLEIPDLRLRVEAKELIDVLKYVQENAADRECWDMADQSLQVLQSEIGETSSYIQVPALTTAEKMDKMSAQDKANQLRNNMGSRTSLGSRISLRSSLGQATDEPRKG